MDSDNNEEIVVVVEELEENSGDKRDLGSRNAKDNLNSKKNVKGKPVPPAVPQKSTHSKLPTIPQKTSSPQIPPQQFDSTNKTDFNGIDTSISKELFFVNTVTENPTNLHPNLDDAVNVKELKRIQKVSLRYSFLFANNVTDCLFSISKSS